MKRLALLSSVIALTSGIVFAQATIVPGEDFMLQWDADADGQVTLMEATERRASMWMMFDTDADGFWSAAELVGIKEHQDLEAELQGEAMRANDQVAGSGPGNSISISALSNLESYDADGNGTLSEAEYVDGTPIWFTLRDRNADGAISMADFGPRK